MNGGRVCEGHYRSDLRSHKRKNEDAIYRRESKRVKRFMDYERDSDKDTENIYSSDKEKEGAEEELVEEKVDNQLDFDDKEETNSRPNMILSNKQVSELKDAIKSRKKKRMKNKDHCTSPKNAASSAHPQKVDTNYVPIGFTTRDEVKQQQQKWKESSLETVSTTTRSRKKKSLKKECEERDETKGAEEAPFNALNISRETALQILKFHTFCEAILDHSKLYK